MRQIKVEKNQTIYDIAIQELGNVEAVFEIISDNNLGDIELTNPLILDTKTVSKINDQEIILFETKDVVLLIREDSVFKNTRVLKELDGKKIYNQ